LQAKCRPDRTTYETTVVARKKCDRDLPGRGTLAAFRSGMIPSAFAVVLATAAANPGLPAPGTYRLDPTHTFVEFRAQHFIVGAVRGRFEHTTGTVIVAKDPAECSVDIFIEAGSLSTQDPIRDAELKATDFLDAAEFPAITYRGKGIRRSRSGWVIDGILTIRGLARAVPLEFTFEGIAPRRPGWPPRIAFRASTAVQRAAFGIIRELGDHVGKGAGAPDVWVAIETEALRQDLATTAKN